MVGRDYDPQRAKPRPTILLFKIMMHPANLLRLLPQTALWCAITALLSCQSYYQQELFDSDSEIQWYTYTPPPPPPPRVIRYSRVARNGIPPFREAALPARHEDFRRSGDYRLTFRTWKNDALLRGPGHKRVVIELTNQRGLCYVDEQIAMDFPVCTGVPSHITPTGIFHISEKDINHRSNLYNCPMPYFMRLTNGGIGLHVGDVYRAPASHGCIRTTRDACIALFNTLPYGTEVIITP